jgi:hypothetical protein
VQPSTRRSTARASGRTSAAPGVSVLSGVPFKEAHEYIIKAELPRRLEHVRRMTEWGNEHAGRLAVTPSRILALHDLEPSRERMLVSECLQPRSETLGYGSRREEAEATAVPGANPFSKRRG